MRHVLRMRTESHRRLGELLRAAAPSESVAFVLCRRVAARDAVIYLADEVLAVDDAEYEARGPDIASVSPIAMARVAKQALATGHIVLMAHLHPMSTEDVEFSAADHLGNHRSFGFFHRRIPTPHHLALVWNASITRCKGLAIDADGDTRPIVSVIVCDGETWHEAASGAKAAEDPAFARQALLLGPTGQRKLARIRVAIVGAGGLGSLVSMGAVHHGIGNLLVVDDDLIEVSNLPRVAGASPADVRDRANKAWLATRYANAHNPAIHAVPVASFVEDPALRPALVAVDVIVTCTDNTTSRAYVNQLGQQYLIPVLDLGVEFVVDGHNGSVVNEVGRVNLMRPGTACMWCSGQIDARRLAAESVPPDERRRMGSYLRGFDEPQPSMMAFNMEIAARGLQVLIGFLTGLIPTPRDVFELRTFLKRRGGSLSRQIAKSRRADCVICGDHGSVGRGDEAPIDIRRKAA